MKCLYRISNSRTPPTAEWKEKKEGEIGREGEGDRVFVCVILVFCIYILNGVIHKEQIRCRPSAWLINWIIFIGISHKCELQNKERNKKKNTNDQQDRTRRDRKRVNFRYFFSFVLHSNMNEDWEQVTPFLHEMQHCPDDDYFNAQEVSGILLAYLWTHIFVFCSTSVLIIKIEWKKKLNRYNFQFHIKKIGRVPNNLTWLAVRVRKLKLQNSVSAPFWTIFQIQYDQTEVVPLFKGTLS